MTRGTYAPEERERHFITEGLVRLLVGLESADDLWADLEHVLAAATRPFRARFPYSV
jgi:methionine-gamma-lyase